MIKKFTVFLALLLMVSLLLVSCAPEEPVEEPVDDEEPEEVYEKYGGVLRSAHYAPGNLDPAFLSTVPDDHIGRQWSDFLVYIGEDNEPDVDRSVAGSWEADESLTVWTFDLRQGILFHDGKEMTSRDVKFTFDRLRDPDVGAATVSLYSNIADITTPDDYTVVFELEEPNSEFLKDLGDYHALIMDADNEDFATNFNGTGPFMIERYEPEDRIVFTRNPYYWMNDNQGNQLPYLDGMEIIFLSESSAQVEALRGGQIDYLIYLPTELIPMLEEDPDVNVYETQSNTAYILRMRSDQPPADDVRVRQALKAATDLDEIVVGALDGYGSAGFTPFSASYGDFYLDVPDHERDVEKAMELLVDAGYEDGLEITIYTQESSPVPAIATIWKEQLAGANVDVDIQLVPSSVYYGDGLWLDVNFAITDWGSRPNPHNYLELAYICDHGGWNESHFCDEELDQLAAAVATELDYDERVRLYHEIQELFIERGPIISFFISNLWGASDNLKGLEPTIGLGTALDLRTVYFEE